MTPWEIKLVIGGGIGGAWGFVGNIFMVYGCGLHNNKQPSHVHGPRARPLTRTIL